MNMCSSDKFDDYGTYDLISDTNAPTIYVE